MKSKDYKALDISLQFHYDFRRAEPIFAQHAYYISNRSLDYEHFNDCLTGKELFELSKFVCGDIKDKTLSTSVIFTQAFNPALVTGQTNWVTEVNQKQKDPYELLHDLKLTYYCDGSYEIVGTQNPTSYSKKKGDEDSGNYVDQWAVRNVDP